VRSPSVEHGPSSCWDQASLDRGQGTPDDVGRQRSRTAGFCRVFTLGSCPTFALSNHQVCASLPSTFDDRVECAVAGREDCPVQSDDRVVGRESGWVLPLQGAVGRGSANRLPPPTKMDPSTATTGVPNHSVPARGLGPG
jgi:hypothetical protein